MGTVDLSAGWIPPTPKKIRRKPDMGKGVEHFWKTYTRKSVLNCSEEVVRKNIVSAHVLQ